MDKAERVFDCMRADGVCAVCHQLMRFHGGSCGMTCSSECLDQYMTWSMDEWFQMHRGWEAAMRKRGFAWPPRFVTTFGADRTE